MFSSTRRTVRPNHFHDLGDFIESTDTSNADRDSRITWASGYQERLTPGTIIYVKDKPGNSRINDTVMLVLRRSTDTQSSLTCLSFCAHRGRKLASLHKTHRLVVPPVQGPRTDPTLSRQQTPTSANTRGGGLNLEDAEVELYINGFRLKQELTLNCEELWNVEREVDVAVIGEVTASSFKEVVSHVKQLFVESLEQAVKDSQGAVPAEATPTRSTPKNKTNDPAKARKHQSNDKRKRTRW
ncbi:uncharacterized protein PV07_06194 [Cladophialophora immunda]|uniref:Uncharacterized protein n=1 Tax=Cladophialophora immunda TaxID=569365 RepID=A0A0D2AYU4_9EURO|nr:uncharacterized protein PV07_06194 [Cladophialophora immunda]KIW30452.1 hypothetical protein PV07_06194 [Cladophialophora immunda]